MSGRQRAPVAVRIAAVGLASLAAAYFYLNFRTQEFGFSWSAWAVAALFALPLALLAWSGLKVRAAAVGVLSVLRCTALLSEIWAASEELRFRQRIQASDPQQMVFEPRRWPFSDHHFLFDPATGQCLAGD